MTMKQGKFRLLNYARTILVYRPTLPDDERSISRNVAKQIYVIQATIKNLLIISTMLFDCSFYIHDQIAQSVERSP